jgi:DNA-damage-inducible protein D
VRDVKYDIKKIKNIINFMKKELIKKLFEKFENACYIYEGVECWSAREMQEILSYAEWRNFLKVVDKAKNSCEKAGETTSNHFVETNKMINLPKGAQRKVDDIALTRYACYLIAQNGDPLKPEIAFAQTYFAIQTRKQELVEMRLLEAERISARRKLSESEKKLSSIIYERGVDEKGFAIIRSKGDKAFFGGYNTKEMKKKLGAPENRPLADYLPTVTIKAKDFATELTSHNVQEKDLQGETSISTEHIENNESVRKILIERGVKPEELPPAEDVQKVQRRIESTNKKILSKGKKLTK